MAGQQAKDEWNLDHHQRSGHYDDVRTNGNEMGMDGFDKNKNSTSQTSSTHGSGFEHVAVDQYKVYKRRWFGMAQVALLSAVASWDWLSFSPVTDQAAEYYQTDATAINWLSTAFFLANCAAAPVVIWLLHTGPRPSMVMSAVLLFLGNWLRYAGTRATAHGNFGVVMFGQMLTGMAQMLVLSAPTRYSDLWFTNRGRIAATAVMSLANPLGAALGQVITPFWVTEAADLPNMTLYMAIIASVSAIPTFFVPARPPTPVAPSSKTPKLGLKTSAKMLCGHLEMWLMFIPFIVYVGLFNSVSTLLNQMLLPYGYSDDEAGMAGGVLIVVGLVASAVSSPMLDRSKRFLLAIKVAVPITALCYLALYWMPPTRGLAGPYVVLGTLGAASFSLMPVVVEFMVELTHPISPEVTSTLAWSGGQLLGGVFVMVSNALKAGPDADPPHHMQRALVFHAVVALAVVPFPLCLGLFGREDKVRLKRVHSDQAVLMLSGDSGGGGDQFQPSVYDLHR